jgi:tetraacyldisaccharide 4'-kinase
MHTIPSALKPAAYIAGPIYQALIRMRNGSYNANLLPQQRLPRPVISIGNITMGGSGKTPLVIHLAQRLLESGFQPAILTRGYGRQHPNEMRILAPGQTVADPASVMGDEPALMRLQVPGAWIGLCKNRFMAGSLIAKQTARAVFLLDDGFQHRKLHRDLDIVVIDRSQPLETNRIFPLGTLREPLVELRRAHILMMNGTPDTESAEILERDIQKLNPKAPIFHCQQTIRALIPFPAWKEGCRDADPAAWDQSVYLVAAVGNPERFEKDIRRLGIQVSGTRYFSDHYNLKPKDWQDCIEEARKKNAAAIVITEKDAVKISQPPDFPLLVSLQSIEISEAKEFEQILTRCMKEHA